MIRALFRTLILWIISVSMAHAATIQNVSADATSFNVKLSREELAQMPWRGPLLIEASSENESVVAPVTIHELLPTKSTVTLVSANPLPQIKRLMTLKFLPLFWDQANSPLLLGPSQLHSFAKMQTGAGSGVLFEALAQRRTDRERRRLSRGASLRFDAVMPLYPDWVGLSLGVEHLSASQDQTISTSRGGSESLPKSTLSQSSRLAKNTLRPGLWTPLGSDLRLGLRVDYTTFETVTKSGSRKDLSMHELVEPQVALTYFDPTFEGTVFFKWGAKSKSSSSGENSITTSLRTPSELLFAVRSPTPRLGLWGAGVGYLFYFWETQVDDAIMPVTSLPELLRARLSWEQRLNNTGKITLLLHYDGGKAPGPWLSERLANTVSLTGGYQTLWKDVWTVGGQVRLELGSTNLKEQVSDGEGKLISRTDKITGLGTEVWIYAQRAVDFGGYSGN